MVGQQGAGKTGGPYPSSPDPKFPNRPDHPDFHMLSTLIQDLDRVVTVDNFEQVVFGDEVDKASLVYLINQRLLRAEMIGALADPKAAFMALYMEAFTMGRKFAEEKQERDDLLNHTIDAGGAHAEDCEGCG